MTSAPKLNPLGLDRKALVAEMDKRDITGMLLTSPENVFYTTGYPVLPSAGNPILYTLRNRLPFYSYVDQCGRISLLCWGFSVEGVSLGVDELVTYNDFVGAVDALESVLRGSLNGGHLGVESTCPHYVTRLAQQVAGGDVAEVDEIMSALRLIKSDGEIACLRRSTAIIEKTVAELFEVLEPNMSRLALMDEARRRVIANGATGISHITFSFAQENPEIAIDEPLKPGSLATLDLGAVVGGYCSDNRRYAYAGALPNSLLRRYEAMVEIVDGVGEALTPGRSYQEVFQHALDLCAEQEVELLKRITHVGHSIGLETEEEWIDDDPDKELRSGMVINIELYSKAPTGEQIGNEETYVVGPDGSARISSLPRRIHVVEV